jgi:hypothetical protein
MDREWKNVSCYGARSHAVQRRVRTLDIREGAMKNMLGAVCLALVATSARIDAAPIEILVDTTSLAGVSSDLAFDLLDGGPPSNTVVISGFATDGTLGASTTLGDVSGALPGPVTLADTDFFNEYLQGLVLGTFISFTFETSGLPPDADSSPDAFAFFLLDPASGFALVDTSDPTGAGALLRYDVGASAPLSLLRADGITISSPSAVPLPATLPLVLLALGLVAHRARRLPAR